MEVMLALLASLLASLLTVLLVVAVLLFCLRARLKRWIAGQLVEAAGPAIVRTMSPRATLSETLSARYDSRPGMQDLITAILGGAGQDPGGSDFTVSRRTTATFRLQPVGDSLARSESTWTHEFSDVRDNHTLVLFATSDPATAALLPNRRVFPLFEMWTLPGEDELEDFVPTLRETLRVGISYVDPEGVVHTTEPEPFPGHEVALRHFDRYVRLPEWSDRSVLRIVELDLHDLANPDHVVARVMAMSIQATVISSLELGYVTWTPPHPCFLENIVFDVRDMATPTHDYEYLVVQSSVNKVLPLGNHWLAEQKVIEVDIGLWMIPGQVVTLLWRPVERPESGDGGDT